MIRFLILFFAGVFLNACQSPSTPNAGAAPSAFPEGVSFLKISGRTVRHEAPKKPTTVENFLRIVGGMREKGWVESVELQGTDGQLWVKREANNWLEDTFGQAFGFHLAGDKIPPAGDYRMSLKTKKTNTVWALRIDNLVPKPAPKVHFEGRTVRFDDKPVDSPDYDDRLFVIGVLEAGQGWGQETPLYTEIVEPEKIPLKAGQRIIDLQNLPEAPQKLKLKRGKPYVFHLTVQERKKVGVIQMIRERAVMKTFYEK